MQAYMIQNRLNGKSYIGITTRSIDRRWYEHKYVSNSCGKLLAKAIKKYGEDADSKKETDLRMRIAKLKSMAKVASADHKKDFKTRYIKWICY